MSQPLRNLPITQTAPTALLEKKLSAPRPAILPPATKRSVPPPLPPQARVPVVVELEAADLVDDEPAVAEPVARTVPRPSGIRLRDERTFGDNDGERSSWSNNVSAAVGAAGGLTKPTAAYMIVRKRSVPPPLPPEEIAKQARVFNAAAASTDESEGPQSTRGRRF